MAKCHRNPIIIHNGPSIAVNKNSIILSGIRQRDDDAQLRRQDPAPWGCTIGMDGSSSLAEAPLSEQILHAHPFLPRYKEERMNSESWLKPKHWGQLSTNILPTPKKRPPSLQSSWDISQLPSMTSESKKSKILGCSGIASRCNHLFPTWYVFFGLPQSDTTIRTVSSLLLFLNLDSES